MKTKSLMVLCSAATLMGLLVWLIGCNNTKRLPPKSIATGGAVHGSVILRWRGGDQAGDRPGQTARESSREQLIPLPDIEVHLRHAASGTTFAQKTDLFGHYEFPLVKPGHYILEWPAQRGWAAGQYGSPIVIGSHTQYPTQVELTPVAGNRLVTGRVKLRDGGSPWFSDPPAGVERTAAIEVQGVALPPVRANFAGEFAHAEVPAGPRQLRATSQGGSGDQVLAATSAPQQVAIVLDNRRPILDAVIARQGGKTVTAAPAGSTVDVAALVADPDGDPLQITWRDGRGAVVGTGATFSWKLPGRAGVFTLYSTVSDGRGGDTKGRVDIAVDAKGVVVTGFVVGPGRVPIPGAKVTMNGGAAATSNGSGYFQLKVPLADRYILNITKPGFAAFSRLFDHPVNGHAWQLVPTQVQTINPSSEVTIVDRRPSLEKKRLRGATLSLPAGALVDQSGRAASGPVNAALATLDIGDDEAPGDYIAVDSSGNPVGLISYGMAYAEFTDGAGQRLNLRPGVSAELRLPIPASMAAQAPAKIDVWSYDDQDGSWKPMGFAELDAAQGDYVAKVSHFSTINMDQSGPVSCVRVHSDTSIPTGLTLRVSDVPGGIDFAQVKEVVLDGPLNAIYRIPALTSVKLEIFDSNHNLLSNVILEDGNTVGVIGTVLAGNVVQSGPASADLWPPPPYTDCKPVTLKLNALWGGYPGSPFLTFRGTGSAANADAYYAFVSPTAGARDTLEQWWVTNGFSATGGDPGAADYVYARTSYLNNNDLGSGRDMHFIRRISDGRLAAYVTNYSRGGPFDQNPVFADDAAAQSQPGATVCMEFAPVEGQADTTPIVKFFVYADLDGLAGTERQKAADLDGFGAKFVPNLCLTCHGGNYGTTVAGLSGANRSQFRELDLATYKFPAGRVTPNAAEQTAFRAQNLMIKDSAATRGPIIDLINGWYPGGVGNQDNSYTPAAWGAGGSGQNDLYHQVVKVSCRTCHIAFDSADDSTGIDWNRYDQFYVRKGTIGSYTIGTSLSTPPSYRVMPHALVTYRNFWIDRQPVHRPETLWLFNDAPNWTPAIGAPLP
jgi:hypothetical protein